MYALLHMHFYAPYAGMLFEGLLVSSELVSPLQTP